jgi:heat shock protein HslJ
VTGSLRGRDTDLVRVVSTAGLLVLCIWSAAFSQQGEITVTGQLSRAMAIGGESTGWAIQLDSEASIRGKRLSSIELQPRDVHALEKLENKHVRATGNLVHRQGVEIGERTLLDPSSVVETQTKAQPRPNSSDLDLTESEWTLEDLGSRRAMDKVKATLAFSTGGKVAGNGSCNRFFGSAQISKGTIKLGPLGSTRMACPEAVMDQEARYLKALEAAERYEVQDQILLVYCKEFEKPLRFVRKQPGGAIGANIGKSPGTAVRDFTPLFSRIWRITNSPAKPAPGSIYIFLPNGTLLQTSCGETYRIAKWTIDKTNPSVLRVVEDNQLAFTAEIAALSDTTLRVKQMLVFNNEARTITLQGIEREFVCPDLPR